MVDLEITEIISMVAQPKAIMMIHNNSDVKAIGNTVPIYIGTSTHIDLLIKLGAETGTASIKYNIDVWESVSETVIRTYEGTELTAAGVDSISVDGLVLGDWIKVRWTGTLSTDNWFASVYVKLIAK